MQRTDVGATRVNKVQDNDLAAEIRKADGATLAVLQREDWRVFIDRLEVFLAVAERGFKLVQRMRPCRRSHCRQRHRESKRAGRQLQLFSPGFDGAGLRHWSLGRSLSSPPPIMP